MEKDTSMLWVEKYRPKKLEDYIFQNKHDRNLIGQMVLNESIPHLLFSGVQGAGKSTIVKILINELDMEPTDVLVINASDETKVEIMRDKVKSFVQTYAMGDFKIVNLEEADYLSGSSQAILRQLMEEFHDNARFILTCNYEYRIIPALRSRLQTFKFKAFPMDQVLNKLEEILTAENVSYDKELVEDYVKISYPDIRKAINLIQQHTFNGKLTKPTEKDELNDYKFKLLDLVEEGDWMGIRDLLCGNIADEEWDEIYKYLYHNLNKAERFKPFDKWSNGIVIINDHMAKHPSMAMPDVNFTACMVRLAHV